MFFGNDLPAFDHQPLRIKNHAVHIKDDGLHLFIHW